MKVRFMTIACVVMSLLAMLGLWQLERSVHLNDDLEKRIATLSEIAAEEKIQSQLIQARFDDFKQEVATHFHDVKSKYFSSEMRSLASIIPHNYEPYKVETAKSRRELKAAKELYEQKKYDEASKTLLELISAYPESPVYLEASYYLIGCFYYTNNKQEAVDWAQKMLRLYPESVWTAKSLLVMADIYYEQDRVNDVLDVYDAIVHTFDDQAVKDQVKQKMVEMGL